MIREGGCLCGAVRFKAEGEPINVRICHCRNCQKAMGSPFFARALFPQTRADGRRRHRPLCLVGDARTGVLQDLRHAAVLLAHERHRGGVALATFDDRNAFAPTEHIWVAEKMDWVKLDDGLPQYPGTAAA